MPESLIPLLMLLFTLSIGTVVSDSENLSVFFVSPVPLFYKRYNTYC